METALRYAFIFLLLCSVLHCIRGEILSGGPNEDFDFDGLPGLTTDLKFFLDAGRDFCLFFPMYKDSELYVTFQVSIYERASYSVIIRTRILYYACEYAHVSTYHMRVKTQYH